MLAEVSDFVHVAVEAGSLLQLAADFVVGEMLVTRLCGQDLVCHTLVIAVLALEVVELLSQLGDQGVLLGASDADWLVAML